jgi:hypothetical protein
MHRKVQGYGPCTESVLRTGLSDFPDGVGSGWSDNGITHSLMLLENVSMLRMARPMVFVAWFAIAAMLPLLAR